MRTRAGRAWPLPEAGGGDECWPAACAATSQSQSRIAREHREGRPPEQCAPDMPRGSSSTGVEEPRGGWPSLPDRACHGFRRQRCWPVCRRSWGDRGWRRRASATIATASRGALPASVNPGCVRSARASDAGACRRAIRPRRPLHGSGAVSKAGASPVQCEFDTSLCSCRSGTAGCSPCLRPSAVRCKRAGLLRDRITRSYQRRAGIGATALSPARSSHHVRWHRRGMGR